MFHLCVSDLQMEHHVMVKSGILTESEFWAGKTAILESLTASSNSGGSKADGSNKGKKLGIANRMLDMNVGVFYLGTQDPVLRDKS